MPASSSDSLLQIEESLQASLRHAPEGSSASLSQRLVSSAKRILLQRVEFQPAVVTSSAQLDKLRAKYAPLNSSVDLVSARLKDGGVCGRDKPAGSKCCLYT